MNAETIYQCPDEAQPIGRSVHLGRLVASYPACAQCRHRVDTGSLSPRRVRWLDRLAEHAANGDPLFGDEGVSGIALNQIDAPVARRVGQAFGLYVANKKGTGVVSCASSAAGSEKIQETTPVPFLLLAGDGRPWSAELMAAAAEGVRRGGCRVVDAGAATAPALLLTAHEMQADGALLVGNASGDPRRVGLTMWGAEGIPCSAGGELDHVRQLFEAPLPSPAPPPGIDERYAAAEPYLAQLREFYHALRPLRVVVETTSVALVRYLERLTIGVAVELIWNPPAADCPAAQQSRLARICRRVCESGAHFGVWIDGDGECCRVVDERGEAIEADSLLSLFARELSAQQSEAVVVVGTPISRPIAVPNGMRVVTCDGRPRAICRAIREHDAALASDRAGGFWFAGPPTCADGLKALTLLLVILSRGDAPLSKVAASAIL